MSVVLKNTPFSTHSVSWDKERLAQLRLWRTTNVGPISFFHLLKRYSSAQEALLRLPTLRRNAPEIPTLAQIEREIENHEKRGYHLLSYDDPLYPQALKTLKDPPPFLSLRGNLALFSRTCFAVVGSRQASQPGTTLARDIAHDLSQQKWVLVSGLAKGIDACIHQASLEQGTIAVIAGSVDAIYPAEHKNLYHEIAEKGLIVSEDPLDQPPSATLFPKRNRLISGLSWGVLVVEASLRSGSLLTAKYAIDQGRCVFAIPGHPLDLRSRGVNRLLKEGAGLVETSQDIFDAWPFYQRKALQEDTQQDYEIVSLPNGIDYESLYMRIYRALTNCPIAIEDLARHVGTSSIITRIILVEMELDGIIERYPGDCVFLLQSLSSEAM